MNKPILRAEGIIVVDVMDHSVLIQCDADESFYRFPGGGVEFGETAAQAIQRELIEEFDLPVQVNELAAVTENIVEYDGEQHHDCTLIHWCRLEKVIQLTFPMQHKERKGIILTKKTVEQLRLKPVYPEGILDVISAQIHDDIKHLIVIKTYG